MLLPNHNTLWHAFNITQLCNVYKISLPFFLNFFEKRITVAPKYAENTALPVNVL